MTEEIKAKSPVPTYKKIEDVRARKKRISREIILDILTILSEEKKIKTTRIMQKAHLDWRTFRKDFDSLLEKDFIARCNEPEVGCYELTKKGEELLKRLKEVEKLLQ